MWRLQRQYPAQQAVLLLWRGASMQEKGIGMVSSMAMAGWDKPVPVGSAACVSVR